MIKEMSEFECLREAGKTYSGLLTLSKAIEFLKFENNWDVKIVNEKINKYNISEELCDKLNVTIHQMEFMKDLQESGEVNIFASRNIIQQRLFVSTKEASHILSVYMTNYTKLYMPENLLA